MIRPTILFIVGLNCLIGKIVAAPPDEADTCQLSTEILTEIRSYEGTVKKIFEEALNGAFAGSTWDR